MTEITVECEEDFVVISRGDEVLGTYGYAHLITSSTVDSFCRSCGAAGGLVEPDARSYPCYHCGGETLDSILVLAGVI